MAGLWEDWADESLFWFEVYYRIYDPAALRAAVGLICTGRPAWEQALVAPVLWRDYRAKLQAQGLGRLPMTEVDSLFEAHLDRLDVTLGDGGRLVGSTTSIADIAVAGMLDEIVRTSTRRERIHRRPNLRVWLDALKG